MAEVSHCLVSKCVLHCVALKFCTMNVYEMVCPIGAADVYVAQ